MNNAITVQRAVRAVVTDLGRFATSSYGISTNGAADQYSARAANILVGNDETAPLIEITATDLVVTTKDPMMLAVTGAPATIGVDGTGLPQWAPFVVGSGVTVSITNITTGLHTYMAVRGTLIAEKFRDSYAHDPLLGIGTTLATGSVLEISGALGSFEHRYLPLFAFGPYIPRFSDTWTLDVLDGPETCEFGDTANVLTRSEFVVDQQSNHVGTRLRGPRLTRQRTGELLSRGVPLGAVEVPPSGDLIALQRGRSVTAGYPVVAVVSRASCDDLGQLRPGNTVRFKWTTLGEAHEKYAKKREHLSRLRERVRTAFAASGLHPSAPPIPMRHRNSNKENEWQVESISRR